LTEVHVESGVKCHKPKQKCMFYMKRFNTPISIRFLHVRIAC